jgi:hypothetical protein
MWQRQVLSGLAGGVMAGPGIGAAMASFGGSGVSALLLVGAAGALLALWLLRSRGNERARAESELRSSEERQKLALVGHRR